MWYLWYFCPTTLGKGMLSTTPPSVKFRPSINATYWQQTFARVWSAQKSWFHLEMLCFRWRRWKQWHTSSLEEFGGVYQGKSFFLARPGIEPGPPAWEATMNNWATHGLDVNQNLGDQWKLRHCLGSSQWERAGLVNTVLSVPRTVSPEGLVISQARTQYKRDIWG